jgi:hypothetical protein
MTANETTTTYTWPDGVIKRIDVREQKNGFAVAYLYADDREEQRTTRTNIRAALRLKGWGTLSDSRDGESVLRVAGLRSGNELIGMLREQGFIATNAHITTDTTAKAESKGLVASIKSRTLRWSGILATLGNAMSMTEGILRKIENNERLVAAGKTPEGFSSQIKMGAAFAMADLPLAVVDEQDNSRQLGLLLKKLGKEYERQGIEVPKTASIFVETSDKGKSLHQRTFDYLHAYANQIKCGLEVIASYFSIESGKEQGNKYKIAAGAIFGPGFLASLLIPEKKIDEEKYAQAGTLGRLWMKIQSNPLSVGGLLGYSNTIATYMSAHDERARLRNPEKFEKKFNRKTGDEIHPSEHYKWDYAIPTVMIGANGLYAASKKTVGGSIGSDAMVQDAYRIASQIINKQPDGALREKAVEATARFFAERTEIKEHYPEARARLIKELDSQRQNPWFELQGLAPYTPTPKRARNNYADGVSSVSAMSAPATNDGPSQLAPSAPATMIHTGGLEHAPHAVAPNSELAATQR